MASSPKPPDPYQTASAQQSAERGASVTGSILNNPNQVNPYGSSMYSIAGWEKVPDASGRLVSVPRYTQTTKLSPDQQRLLGLQTQMQYNMGQTGVEQSAKLRQHLGKSLNTAGLQGWSTGQAPGEVRQDQGPTDRRAIEEAMLGRYREQAGKQASAEDVSLAARGMAPGSAQYGSVADTRARALTDATQQAYLGSGQESRAAEAAYNQAGLQRYQTGQDYASFLNNLRQGQLQERVALRNQPLNEISALMSGGQVTMPQFNPFTAQGVNAANVGQYIGNNYAQQSKQYSDFMSGLFGIGSAAVGGWAGK